MKKIFTTLFVFASFVNVANAQLYVDGDVNKDGKVSLADLPKLISMINGTELVGTPESLIAGTWRSADGAVITLKQDGTTDYNGACKFKYNNTEKTITFFDSNNSIVDLMNVKEANSAYLRVKSIGQTSDKVYYTSKLFAESIQLSESAISLDYNESFRLNTTIKPETAFKPSCLWSSSDESIATVDQTGLVTGVKYGTVYITASVDNISEVNATCTVSVNPLLVSSIQLSESELEMHPNNTATLSYTIQPQNATNLNIKWISEDESIATVENGIVTAKSAGTTTIYAIAIDGSGVKGTCNVDVVENRHKGHVYVDLGTGVKWATCNLGANSPEEYGNYYAWGETSAYGEAPSEYPSSFNGTQNSDYMSLTEKSTYDWTTYKYCLRNYGNLTKYNHFSSYGPVDNKRTLDSVDDAAQVKWGGDWRMPTQLEMDALVKGCYWEWVTSYNGKNVRGYVVYKAKSDSDRGKYSYKKPILDATYTLSDPHIFIPAAGRCQTGVVILSGQQCEYWSSSLYYESSRFAHSFMLYDNYNSCGHEDRCYGLSVRAVCP